MLLRVSLVLVLVLVAGCSQSGSTPSSTTTESLPATPTQASTANATRDPAAPVVYKTESWGSQAISVTPATPASFQVDVPAGGRNATLQLHADQYVTTQVTLELEGCGSVTISANVALGFIYAAQACDAPASGAKTLTVQVQAGMVQGAIVVIGLTPAG